MKIGYCLCGSFCTVGRSLEALRRVAKNYEVYPIVSEAIAHTDTRFGKACDTRQALIEICAREPIETIVDAEPLGPKNPLDAMIICPCTGNTLAKLSHGITDGTVTMAAKAHLRCDRPLIIAVSTNDALSQNLKNIASLLVRKSVFFVPFGQDAPSGKPYSLISDFSLLEQTLELALVGKQLQPILLK